MNPAPAAAVAAALTLTIGLVAAAPAPAIALGLHDELRWTEGLQLAPQGQANPHAQRKPTPVAQHARLKPIVLARADRPQKPR